MDTGYQGDAAAEPIDVLQPRSAGLGIEVGNPQSSVARLGERKHPVHGRVRVDVARLTYVAPVQVPALRNPERIGRIEDGMGKVAACWQWLLVPLLIRTEPQDAKLHLRHPDAAVASLAQIVRLVHAAFANLGI